MEEHTIPIKIASSRGEKTRVALIRQLATYDAPVSAYQVAKDLKLPLNRVSPALKRLVADGAVTCPEEKRYAAIPCLSHYEDHLPSLLPFLQCVADCNEDATPEQVMKVVGYILSLVTITPDDEGEAELCTGQPLATSPAAD